MTFTLRIDLDTRACVREGLPRILEALRRTDATASFYVVLGSEPFLPSLLYRKFIARKKYRPWYSPLRRPHVRKSSLSDYARRFVFPVNFSLENADLLREAAREHDFGCHSMEHERWAVGLQELDLDKEFGEMISAYKKIFKKRPASFVSPVFRCNERVLQAMDSHGFTVGGDLPGDEPFHPVVRGKKFRHVQVPVNLKCEDTVPLVEHYAALGLPDGKIIKNVCAQISEKQRRGLPAVLYGHGLLEGAVKHKVLQGILSFVKEEGIEVLDCAQLAGRYAKNFKSLPLQIVNR